MKKLLLSLFCLIGFLGANATEVTFDFTENDYGLTHVDSTIKDDKSTEDVNEEYPDLGKTITLDGVSITLDKLEGSGVRYWVAKENTFRVNKNSGITIAAKGHYINTVTFTGTLGTFTVNVGKYDTSKHVWTGASESLTFTNSGSSTIQIKTITIEYSDNSEAPVEPEPEVTSVKTVAETIALESGTAVKVDYELTVGFVHGSNVFACDADGDFIQIYNSNTLKVGDKIPAGWEATYTLFNDVTPELQKCTLPTEVTAGTFTPAEVAPSTISNAMVNSVVMIKNVVFDEATPAAQENFTGKVGDDEVTFRNNYKYASVPAGTYDVTVVVTIYQGAPSLYIASYNTGEEEPVEPTPSTATTVKTVAQTIALASDTKVKVDYELTVGFVNGSNVFVCDAAGDFIQIYNSNTLKVGDKIPAGWEATYTLYNNVTPELTKCTLPTGITAGTFTAKEVAADAITNAMVNHVVMIKNVVFAEATPAAKENFTAKVGDAEITLRNNYSLGSVPAGTYDVVVVVTIFEGAPSLYVASYNTTGDQPVEPEATVVKSVAETIALASGTAIKVDYELTVGWVSNRNVFVCDAAGDFIQIYNENTLKVGDKIPAGWTAVYTLYNSNTPEIEKANLPDEVTAGTFTPAEVAAADVDASLVNSVVLIKNVVLDAATPAATETDNNKKNFTGKVGDVELNFRNNYKVESVPAGTYDITVVVTLYNGEPSLYVTNFAKSSGLDSVTVDAAEAVYYNLNGVRVANPENGIFIRIQSGKAEKVMVK